jgi:U4/U6 small nuclear ribonucleoprotein PRP4
LGQRVLITGILLVGAHRARRRIDAQQAELETPVSQRKKVIHDLYSHLKVCRARPGSLNMSPSFQLVSNLTFCSLLLTPAFQTYTIFSSQLADDRPLTYLSFSPNSKLLATSSWSGLVKLHSIPGCSHLLTLRGHRERVSGLGWHPGATVGLSPKAANLVTGAADGGLFLWSLAADTPLVKLAGHKARISRVGFHPSGDYVASTSFDASWRLWDVERGQEILLQEGHDKEVYAMGFQGDGSLLGTGWVAEANSLCQIRRPD